MKTANDIINAIGESPFHLKALQTVEALSLPDWWIAAGFARNHIWDCLHQYDRMTPLNDIDVIYYDAGNLDETFEKEQEEKLHELMPGHNWSVKNQARMHVRNHEEQYTDIEEALSRWLESVTPVGVNINGNKLDLIAPLGIDDLVNCECRATPYARNID